jgi:hypothetical protein
VFLIQKPMSEKKTQILLKMLLEIKISSIFASADTAKPLL